MAETTIILVDYDNTTTTQELRPQDTRSNLADLCRAIRVLLSQLNAPKDVLMRLYGGWHFDDGRLTPRADWLLRALPDFQVREDGVRLRPQLTSSVAAASGRTLRGTYRNVAGPEQKMVDSMIVVDVLHYAAQNDLLVLVATSDRDVMPALVAAQRTHARGTRVAWVRDHAATTPNDHLLTSPISIVTW